MSEKRYSPSHEWVVIHDDIATIGITEFAQASLGTIVFVDLPNPGKSFKENDIFGVVESVKSASDLYLPMSGEVLEINEAVATNPELINENAEENWMIKLKVTNPSEFAKLLSKEDYDALAK